MSILIVIIAVFLPIVCVAAAIALMRMFFACFGDDLDRTVGGSAVLPPEGTSGL